MKIAKRSLVVVAILLGALVLRAWIVGPHPQVERSLVCNFSASVLEAEGDGSTGGSSECFLTNRVDNWYYLVGEFGLFLGDDSVDGPLPFEEMLESIRAGSFQVSSAYAEFCGSLFNHVMRRNRSELISIAEADTNNQFSLTCPAEES